MATINCMVYDIFSETPSDYIQTKLLFDTSRVFVLGLLIYMTESFFNDLIFLIHNSISKNQIDAIYFMIPILLSFRMKILIKKGLKCDKILKYLIRYQYSVLFLWPVEIFIFLTLFWIYYQSFFGIIIQVISISIGLLFEIFFLLLIRKMIRLESTGEFYCLENIGKKLPQAQVVNEILNTFHICETSFANEVIAWPIKAIQIEKSKALPQNLECEVKDFSNK